MWMGRYWSRTGTYSDEYGPVWVPGNSTHEHRFRRARGPPRSCVRCCARRRRRRSPATSPSARGRSRWSTSSCATTTASTRRWSSGGHGDVLRPHGDQRVDHRLHQRHHTHPSIEGAVFAGCPYDPTHHRPPCRRATSSSRAPPASPTTRRSSARSRPPRSRRPPWSRRSCRAPGSSCR